MSEAVRGTPVIVDAVRKRFGNVDALMPTSIEVRAGEFLTLLGPSGSGKTTLLNITAGYIAPDSGRICLGDRDVTNVPPRLRNIGMVFQNYALFPHLDVFDNVAYGLKVRGRPASEIRSRVVASLGMVKLDGLEHRQIQQLSGGQQQRVALARAMVIEPDLLLMDEPLGALDRQLRKHVQLELRRLHSRSPRTTIYVTHDQEEALVMSDRIAIMSHGRLEQVGTPAELYRAPKNAFVAMFLGESNLLPAKVIDRGREVSFDLGDRVWRIPNHEALPRQDQSLLLVRPEDFHPAAPTEEGLDATVEEVVYLGELTAVRLKLAAGETIWMRRMKLPPLRIGDPMRIRWDPASVRLLESPGQSSQ